MNISIMPTVHVVRERFHGGRLNQIARPRDLTHPSHAAFKSTVRFPGVMLVQSSGGFGGGAAVKPSSKNGSQKKGRPIAPSKNEPPNPNACPCGSKLYANCCEPYIQGNATEPSAEAVLRARFSAYVKRECEYIATSTHPDNPDMNRGENPEDSFQQLIKDADQTCKTTTFLKLTIVSVDNRDEEAFVTFRASFQQGKWKERAQVLNERAHFVRCDGRWLYRAATPLNTNKL
mmetsp:Transcript_16684/g.31945  ORF Transcript_16684/g.31945 Transcript_16684/m.31945 type:complete len:232 (+) Transcript_16684:63-758(+)